MKKYIRNTSKSVVNINESTLKQELHEASLKRLKDKRVKFSRSKKKRAIERNKLNRLKKQRLERYSKELEHNLPKSEQWFRSLYQKECFNRKHQDSLFQDKYNEPFNNVYIPDVCNRGYKYVIEIDGSFHDIPEQKYKDIKKDYYFQKRGYLVIRVKDKDLESYNKAIELIKARIEEIDNLCP